MAKLTSIFVRFALAFLRGLSGLWKALGRWSKPVAPFFNGISKILVNYLILPIYRAFLMLRLRFGRLMRSARGFAFVFFTNRYVFHMVVATISLVAVGTQLQTKNATALDAGQRSLLYALVTDGQQAMVQEDIRPEVFVKDAHYLGSDVLTAVPSIDFDYDEDADLPIAGVHIPGSVAAVPGADQPGIPGQITVERTKTETYTVEPGDTISTIAHKFGVNIGTVLWANNLTARSTIRPGTTLRIPAVSGVLHTVQKGDTISRIAAKYGSNEESILAFNKLASEATLRIGEEITVPGGTPPATAPIVSRQPVATRPDVPISRIANKATDIYQELSGKNDNRAKPEDVKETEAANKSKLLWPTKQRVINQYYGWKHTGVDLDGDYTDPIYASEDGTVETAGWNSGGYGLQIVINHGGGTKTRYAHASKMFVKAGDKVKRGQVIAMVGTTGRSTGTHLHYEVYINNKRVNPLAYTR